MKNFIFIILFSGFSFFASFVFADDSKKLDEVRASIKAQKKKMNEQKKDYSTVQKQLEKEEKEIAKRNAQILKNQQALKKIENESEKLKEKVEKLLIQRKQVQNVIETQFALAFKIGRYSELELLFNAEKNEQNQRILSYLRFINSEYIKTLEQLKTIQTELDQTEHLLITQREQQKELIEKAETEKNQLLLVKKKREQTLKELDVSMRESKKELSLMQQNEKSLLNKIVKAEKAAKRKRQQEEKHAKTIKQKQKSESYKPTKSEQELLARTGGLGSASKKYPRPVNGRILHSFGSQMAGDLRWKGTVIDAQEGTSVKAIASGKVILASWLQGYGFVVILDHGKNDMSLYGYTQQVLVNIGDNVSQGDQIALVGNTGGQKKSGLYFEIRRDGKALNPMQWVN